jgi:Skp family chaperone for outer membrane proteins
MSDMVSTLEVLMKVDAFYNAAWGRLITFMAIAFPIRLAVVGILMPILIQLYQRNTFDEKLNALKAETANQKNNYENQLKALKDEATKQIEDAKTAAKDYVEQSKRQFAEAHERQKKEFDERITVETAKLDKKNLVSLGSTLHVQGIVLVTEKRFEEAIGSYARAIGNYINGEDDSGGATTCLGNIIAVLGDLTARNFTGVFPDPTPVLSELIKFLSNEKNRAIYFREVDAIDKALSDAKKRTPPK